jgi:hypothetical protein
VTSPRAARHAENDRRHGLVDDRRLATPERTFFSLVSEKGAPRLEVGLGIAECSREKESESRMMACFSIPQAE